MNGLVRFTKHQRCVFNLRLESANPEIKECFSYVISVINEGGFGSLTESALELMKINFLAVIVDIDSEGPISQSMIDSLESRAIYCVRVRNPVVFCIYYLITKIKEKLESSRKGG